MRIKKHTPGKYVSFAIAFVIVIGLIIIGSLIWRMVALWQESVFDGSHQFIISVAQPESFAAVDLDPQGKTIHTLVVKKDSKTQGNPVVLPYDLQMVSTKPIALENAQDIRSFLSRVSHNTYATHLTIFDTLRMWLFLRSVEDKNILFKKDQLPLSEEATEKTIPDFFSDTTVYTQGQSIAMVNASGKVGKGTQVGKALANVGFHVLSITSSDAMQKETQLIAAKDGSYTLTRLMHIFHVTHVKEKTKFDVADITIVLGRGE